MFRHTVPSVGEADTNADAEGIRCEVKVLKCIRMYIYVYIHITPRSKVLPNNLTGLRLVKKLPAFYGSVIVVVIN
jgi:hypothetical protein